MPQVAGATSYHPGIVPQGPVNLTVPSSVLDPRTRARQRPQLDSVLNLGPHVPRRQLSPIQAGSHRSPWTLSVVHGDYRVPRIGLVVS